MLEKLMTQAFAEMQEIVTTFGCTYRMGAYILALRKLAYAEEIKGIFP